MEKKKVVSGIPNKYKIHILHKYYNSLNRKTDHNVKQIKKCENYKYFTCIPTVESGFTKIELLQHHCRAKDNCRYTYLFLPYTITEYG